MERRLLITGGGTGPTGSLIRSLRTGHLSYFIVGCHDDRFVLKKSSADRNYLTPASDHPQFAAALRDIIDTERIELLVPNSDRDVRTVSTLRDQLACRVFLPTKAVVELCQDKYELAAFLRSRDLPAPLTLPVTDLAEIDDLFRMLAGHRTVWCRIRHGTGSVGAIPVRNAEQARAWISYWAEMRDVAPAAFTLSEFLPGRDFTCESLWKDGELVLVKTAERLSYFGGAERPSGTSSNAALAKTIFEPRVVDVCMATVRALDPSASGLFSIDLKENSRGAPCVTEINIGRVLSTTTMFDLVGRHNMALTYVRLGLGEPVDVRGDYDAAPDYYFVRDIDTHPDVFHADEFFRGITEPST